ncbi:phosphatidylinositol N-acetylglucosaminyltransferase [Spizellomyces sp. 'palustris']|nr:phosphatidylinositol N-acetylglucosaminyltransferase [Spizellomyces sp. 'palustris']
MASGPLPSPTLPTTPTTQHRASEKREYYGFVLYLSSFVAFGTYLAWALLPDEVLHALGIYYYPTRWWAIVFPVYILGLIPFTILMFTGINLRRTPPLTSFDTVTDDCANALSIPLDPDKLRKLFSEDSIPEIEDIPISLVNQVLYQQM